MLLDALRASFLAVIRSERNRYLQSIIIAHIPERVEEFLQTFGVREEVNTKQRGGVFSSWKVSNNISVKGDRFSI